MHMEENMVEIIKFIYVMVNFISVFLVSMNVEGNPFLNVLNFLNYLLHNILSHFNNTLLLFFFITTGRKCKQDSDCPEYICTFPWKPTCVEAYFLMYNRQNYCTCT